MHSSGMERRRVVTMNRRGFVKNVTFGLAGMSIASDRPTFGFTINSGGKMVYRRLGRTGFQVSEIGLGGHYDGPNWQAKNSKDQKQRNAVFAECIESGVNFFDTNTDYERQSLGISLGTMPAVRERVMVVADINDKDGTQEEIYRFLVDSVDEQLRMFGLPHVEIMRFTTVARRTPPEKCEAAIRAFETAKKAGKVKYLAFSQHDPELLLEWIHRYDEIDIVYVPYNYFMSRADRELFSAAKKRDIGVVVIKPFNKGTIFNPALQRQLQGSGLRSILERAEKEKQSRTPEDLTKGTSFTLAQASLGFILSNPDISTVIPGMETVDELRENLKMAGKGPAFGKAERAILDWNARQLKKYLPPEYEWLNSWRCANSA